ncbi:MAG: PaaI family thioesterase [Syntrophales bacterium]|nr:PaaI family thioesterase [Syntrophales bacterium]MDD5641811.1 PaaI family thioesterase [Syntrophales bacterium]
MKTPVEPLPPELEKNIRARLAANPFIKFMGIQAPQLGRGYAQFVLPFKGELANSIGLLQGGAIAALADEAVAFALYSLVKEGETINTVEMKINFLAAVKEGEVEAAARITKRGRTISLGEVEVRQGERLVAKAMCTYIHLAKK